MTNPAYSRRRVSRSVSSGARNAIAGLALLATACSDVSPVSPGDDGPSVAARTVRAAGADKCVPDSKLIGSIELSTVDAPSTWWGLTKAGLEAAGIIGPVAQKAAIDGFFGQTFADLPSAIEFLVDQVRPYDANGDNHVCAYALRGTRAAIGDPNWAFYSFGVRD